MYVKLKNGKIFNEDDYKQMCHFYELTHRYARKSDAQVVARAETIDELIMLEKDKETYTGGSNNESHKQKQ